MFGTLPVETWIKQHTHNTNIFLSLRQGQEMEKRENQNKKQYKLTSYFFYDLSNKRHILHCFYYYTQNTVEIKIFDYVIKQLL